MTIPAQAAQCRYCTAPTDGGDVCGFCASYTPPTPAPTATQRLDDAVNLVDTARHDIGALLRVLPDSAPLFSVVDLVTAVGHLRQAAVLIDKATDALEADTGQREAVAR